MKQVILLLLVAALAGCGGVHKARKDARRSPSAVRTAAPVVLAPAADPFVTAAAAAAPVAPAAPVPRPFARGPLNSACMGSDRKARSSELCGCIQAVANATLSGSQQRLAVSFYSDPHKAQEIRQSSKPADEEFWRAYKTYGEAAERTCS